METDDPTHPKVTLTVTANVVVDLDFENSQLRFRDAKVGEEAVQVTPFIEKVPGSARFGDIASQSEYILARIVKMDDGRQGLEVKVTPNVAGHLGAKIEVALVEPEPKKLTVFVTGNAIGDIRAVPGVLSMNISPGATQAKGCMPSG